MTRVFVDTNVFYSALVKPSGYCASLLSRIESKQDWRLASSAYVFEELRKLQFTKYSQKNIQSHTFTKYLYYLVDNVPIVSPIHLAENLNNWKENIEVHTKDLHVWIAFKTSEANYLLTGNTKNFPMNDCVVTPSELLQKI